ncbi:hypothetical protein C8Q79DRAFT_252888 [Trametes meyenii]|nr:hypothetical protein C8Q79DRAFT_252888 [Trametes meyenii]
MSSQPKQGFNLDISNVAGFFGGEIAISAMATVHVYPGRRWLGCYNQPGCYEIAKWYGKLARSRLWDTLHPGPAIDPAVLFRFDRTEAGPKYIPVLPNAVEHRTGHVARLFFNGCKALPPLPTSATGQRTTSPGSVTVVHVTHDPNATHIPPLRQSAISSLISVIPIGGSVVACAQCALVEDWYCFSVILLGMVVGAAACYIIGSGELSFRCRDPQASLESDANPDSSINLASSPTTGSVFGLGLLHDNGDDFVIVRGPQSALTAITQGRFALDYSSQPAHHNIGLCSVILSIQFLAQLLFIPQGALNGQLLFLGSLAISWVYNSYLSSLDIESFQRGYIFENILHLERAVSHDCQPQTSGSIKKYELGTRTATVVLTLLVLAHDAEASVLRSILDELLPNDTPVWNIWKAAVMQNIVGGFQAAQDNTRGRKFNFQFPTTQEPLLHTLYDDAHFAAQVYCMH